MNGQYFSYIEFLITTHKCVTLPGLGGFILNLHSAGSTVYGFDVPKYDISFNMELNHDDGVLANYICKRTGVGYSVAIQEIKSFVKDIQVSLYTHGVLQCGRLGCFSLINGMTVFVKNKEYVNPSLFGLTPLYIDKLDVINVKQETSQRKYFRIRQVIGGVAAVGLAFLLMAIPTIKIEDGQSAQLQESNFMTSLLDNILLSEKDQAKGNEAAKANHEYFLIISVQTDEERAQRALQDAIKKGFKESAILDVNGSYRVYVESFVKHSEAIDYLGPFAQKNPEYFDAWVYKGKPYTTRYIYLHSDVY